MENKFITVPLLSGLLALMACNPKDDTSVTHERILAACEAWCEIAPRCYEADPPGSDCVNDRCIPQYFRFEECTEVAITDLECHAALTCDEYDAMFIGEDPCEEAMRAWARCNGDQVMAQATD